MRRTARECAVQFLYQLDLHRPPAVDRALAGFWTFMDAATGVKIEAATRVFGDSLINGTLEKMPEVDAKLKSLADNWELDRLAAVDRNILRLAIYEMLFREEIPPIVSINEAIEIAKRFSTEDSGRFVNGVLDRLRKELLRPARHASTPGPT